MIVFMMRFCRVLHNFTIVLAGQDMLCSMLPSSNTFMHLLILESLLCLGMEVQKDVVMYPHIASN